LAAKERPLLTSRSAGQKKARALLSFGVIELHGADFCPQGGLPLSVLFSYQLSLLYSAASSVLPDKKRRHYGLSSRLSIGLSFLFCLLMFAFYV
jgi:hypothetical protein